MELFGYSLPVAAQLGIVAAFAVLFTALSIRKFGKPASSRRSRRRWRVRRSAGHAGRGAACAAAAPGHRRRQMLEGPPDEGALA